VTAELIVPDWPAPPSVRALVTTRSFGDMRAGGAGRARVPAIAPAEPLWLRQVHGCGVVRADDVAAAGEAPAADAAIARRRLRVCAVLTADCLPVLLASRTGDAVGVAHAGWRGLAAGVIEATVHAMAAEASQLVAWLGPAIGPRAYEVGADVRDAFLARDAQAASAFVPSRPGHWQLDLYAVARQRLRAAGVTDVSGGAFCTHAQPERFFSWRREREAARMAALIWLA
jgi:YfiH family protein